MHSPKARLQIALQQPQPSLAALELARALRDEGMSQLDLYQLFDEFRDAHASDADEILFDAVLDTLDFISGWCSPNYRLFDTELPHDAA
jgi:hypothetical protein